MKRAIFCALALAVPLAATAAPEHYALDPIHTVPHFAINHLGVSTVYGQFNKLSGDFTLDRAAKKASLEINIEAASISTGDSDRGSRPRSRDEHLRSADFFNVGEFPRISFKADDVKFDGDSPAEVSGQLTLLGVTRPLTLKIDRWVCKDHPFSKKPMCGGDASATIKRSEFGMKYGLPAIGDEIRLFMGFEGYRQ
jgi:polyisoprenoid-binding protein YceI